MSTGTFSQRRSAGIVPGSQSVKVWVISVSEAEASVVGAEQLANAAEQHSPAGRNDELCGPAVDHDDHDLGQVAAADVLALGHFLSRERHAMVQLLVRDAVLR